jgi:hypothetical protein
VALTPGAMSGLTHVLASGRDGHPGWVRLGRVVEAQSADVALFPFDLASCIKSEGDLAAVRSIVRANAEAGLRTVLGLTHDTTQRLSLGHPHAIVVRTSMLRSMDYPGEHPGAVTVADPLAGGAFEVRPWRSRAHVGFMGFAEADATHRVLRLAASGGPVPEGYVTAPDPGRVAAGHVAAPLETGSTPVLRQPINIGLHVRRRALEVLRSSTVVDSSLVVRDRYFGHYAPEAMRDLRTEYIRHLFGSDYVLCVRGAGNYSIRLFETMAAGRVPVIVDTDLVLPCADEIDWRRLAVWVPLEQLDRLDRIIANEHAEAGPRGFHDRQHEIRQAWAEHLSPAGFSRYVASRITTTWRGGEAGD